MTGCNIGAKNTMIMNYLPLAKQRGHRSTRKSVTAIRPAERRGYRYRVEVLHREEIHGKLHSRDVVLYTNVLIVSAGTFGTNKLLLQAQMRGDFRFSSQLGKPSPATPTPLGQLQWQGTPRLDRLRAGRDRLGCGADHYGNGRFPPCAGRRHLIEDAAFPRIGPFDGTVSWYATALARQPAYLAGSDQEDIGRKRSTVRSTIRRSG
ncbi:MAG: hypothetical protein R2867_16140 [Caldilineaceae bacterium]